LRLFRLIRVPAEAAAGFDLEDDRGRLVGPVVAVRSERAVPPERRVARGADVNAVDCAGVDGIQGECSFRDVAICRP